jgi:hypothetical protein
LLDGLKEYLTGYSIPWAWGREIVLENVVSTHAEAEELATFPAVVIIPGSTAEYDPSSRLTPSTPVLVDDKRMLGLMYTSELKTELFLEVWASTLEERKALRALIEDAMSPVDFMSGFLLEIPAYFNERAAYMALDVSQSDSPENALRGIWAATFRIDARIPVYRVVQYKPMKPRVRTVVVEPGRDSAGE